MKMKNLALETGVIVACYLVMMLPVASATQVNVMVNGQVMETVEYNPSNIVSLDIDYVRDPNDIAWSNVRIGVELKSASLAHSIKRVYVYKCGSLSPSSCMQKTPEVFDTYVDTEIAWADVSQTTGPQTYPQEGSLLFLVKIENPDGLTSWVGLWNTIRRQSFREFLFIENELSGMNVYAESPGLVGPIAYYIQNFQSVPFRWLTRASFDDALSISAVGGDDSDLDSSPPTLQSVEPPGKDIDVINKENYFVFPRTSSGFGFPITLEKNPDFECGDGYCESSLGESSDTCCFDCGCPSGQFCDAIPGSPESGSCREKGLLDFTVVGTPSAEVSDCSRSFEVGITARFSNVPASMKEGVTGVVKVEGSTYPVQCTGESGLYGCRFVMSPTISCGSVTKQLGPNELKLTVTYMDGINSITEDLVEEFPAVSLDYECGCPDGKYCDTGQETCETISGVTLNIIELNSYMEDYDVGDPIILKAKISNPPTGTKLLSTSANFSLSEGKVFPGAPVCTGPEIDDDGGFIYDCRIPFNIEPYDESKNYKFYPNFLEFDIDFNDGPDKRTMTLSKQFGPISIPSQNCGNGVLNVGETSENCCQDAGCGDFGESYYCDVTRGCMDLDDISLSAIAYPVELEDCKSPNEVNLEVTVGNAPYGIRLDSKSLTVNNQPVPWRFECPGSNIGGVFTCMFEIPPIDGCKLPFFTVGPNQLSFTISFPEGVEDGFSNTLELSAGFQDILITPIPHIDGVCEAELGENGATACLDCPCEEDPSFGSDYYCDSSKANPEGTCLPKGDVGLVVESPTTPVWFGTCERTNKYSVLMHIRNQPTGMRSENVFATLGGSAAKYVSCRESKGTYLDSNITFNCTIMIPSTPECSVGRTYNYTGNSISMVVSYDNGDQGTVLQTLTTHIPDAFVTQSYRSMNDIMNDAKNQMMSNLDKMMSLTADMADTIETCIQLQIMVMILGIGFSIGMGLAAGGFFDGGGNVVSGEITAKNPEVISIAEGLRSESSSTPFDFKAFGQGISAVGSITSSVSGMIQKWCDMLYQWNQIQQKLLELQIEKQEVETCLEIHQHALDSGKCNGQEVACFDSIRACLNFGEMRTIRDSIQNDVNKMNADMAGIGSDLSDIGDAISDGPWGDDGTGDSKFLIKVAGESNTVGQNVCKYSGQHSSNCIYSEIKVYIGVDRGSCGKDKYVHLLARETGTSAWTGSIFSKKADSNGGLSLPGQTVSNDEFFGALVDGKTNEIGLFCSEYSVWTGQDIDSKTKQIGSSVTMYEGNPNSQRCTCTDSGGREFQGVNMDPSETTEQTVAYKVKKTGLKVYENYYANYDDCNERVSEQESCELYKNSTIEYTHSGTNNKKQCNTQNLVFLKVRVSYIGISEPNPINGYCKNGVNRWIKYRYTGSEPTTTQILEAFTDN